MKNLLKNHFSLISTILSFCLLAILPFPAFSQSIAITGNANDIANGLVTIETKLDPSFPITNSSPDNETSVGFFYRLENTTNGKSYFWQDFIYDNIDNETATETLKLPVGTYTVTAYESRKSRPIRSTKLSGSGNFTVYTNTNNYTFPEISLGNSLLKLFSSWNINWHQFPPYSPLPPEHYTKPLSNSDFLPGTTEPWVFMTLVKKDWIINAPINITFPDFLSFGGAIAGDYMNDISKKTTIHTAVAPNPPGIPQSVDISNISLPAGEQVIIHLIFKKKVNYIPSEPYPETASFTASYYITDTSDIDSILFDTTFVFKPKPKPHDPNRLTVDKKELCECGSDEYLTYRIDYQNDGEAPVDTVFVALMDLNHLQKASIKHNNDTDDWSAPINDNLNFLLQKNEFLIDYKDSSPQGLPGLKQNSISYPKPSAGACQDYFHIRVKKDDCLSAGEKIQPKAMITFLGTNDTIYTNLDETLIVDRTNCKPCPPNIKCPNCPKKKPCWLFAWFRKKNNT